MFYEGKVVFYPIFLFFKTFKLQYVIWHYLFLRIVGDYDFNLDKTRSICSEYSLESDQ